MYSPQIPVSQVLLLFVLYRWRNLAFERENNLPKVTLQALCDAAYCLRGNLTYQYQDSLSPA